MADPVIVHLYLDKDSREGLEDAAKEMGLSLSGYLRALGRFMREPVNLKTPMSDLKRRWRLLLLEEALRAQSMAKNR